MFSHHSDLYILLLLFNTIIIPPSRPIFYARWKYLEQNLPATMLTQPEFLIFLHTNTVNVFFRHMHTRIFVDKECELYCVFISLLWYFVWKIWHMHGIALNLKEGIYVCTDFFKFQICDISLLCLLFWTCWNFSDSQTFAFDFSGLPFPSKKRKNKLQPTICTFYLDSSVFDMYTLCYISLLYSYLLL